METSTSKSILSAVTATTTSSAIEVGGAEKITIMLTAAAITSGNGVFTVSGSIDGTTFVALNNLRDNATGVLTLVASKTVSANSSVLIGIDLETFGYSFIKVIATVTTDGAYSASCLLEY